MNGTIQPSGACAAVTRATACGRPGCQVQIVAGPSVVSAFSIEENARFAPSRDQARLSYPDLSDRVAAAGAAPGSASAFRYSPFPAPSGAATA